MSLSRPQQIRSLRLRTQVRLERIHLRRHRIILAAVPQSTSPSAYQATIFQSFLDLTQITDTREPFLSWPLTQHGPTARDTDRHMH